MEDVDCGDRPEGVPGGGRKEVGRAVLTIVEQTQEYLVLDASLEEVVGLCLGTAVFGDKG